MKHDSCSKRRVGHSKHLYHVIHTTYLILYKIFYYKTIFKKLTSNNFTMLTPMTDP